MTDAHIPRQRANSSNIISYGYDPARQILAIERSNGVYHHEKVPPGIFAAFEAHPSKGTAYHLYIRDYAGVKVDAPPFAPCSKCGEQGLAGEPCPCGDGTYGDLPK